jgi:hypothetical protein
MLCDPKADLRDPADAIVGGCAPVVFGPGTLWRTWGTRPIPMGFCYDTDSEGTAENYPDFAVRGLLVLTTLLKARQRSELLVST